MLGSERLSSLLCTIDKNAHDVDRQDNFLIITYFRR